MATWLFAGLYWVLLWRRAVLWNGSRITRTWASAIVAIMLGTVVGALGQAVLPDSDDSFGCFIGSLAAPITWLILTVFAWRETPAERRARLGGSGRSAVACPSCGYNLTGLTATRCPECGSQYTLDELMAAQAAQQVEEVED